MVMMWYLFIRSTADTHLHSHTQDTQSTKYWWTDKYCLATFHTCRKHTHTHLQNFLFILFNFIIGRRTHTHTHTHLSLQFPYPAEYDDGLLEWPPGRGRGLVLWHPHPLLPLFFYFPPTEWIEKIGDLAVGLWGKWATSCHRLNRPFETRFVGFERSSDVGADKW